MLAIEAIYKCFWLSTPLQGFQLQNQSLSCPPPHAIMGCLDIKRKTTLLQPPSPSPPPPVGTTRLALTLLHLLSTQLSMMHFQMVLTKKQTFKGKNLLQYSIGVGVTNQGSTHKKLNLILLFFVLLESILPLSSAEDWLQFRTEECRF